MYSAKRIKRIGHKHHSYTVVVVTRSKRKKKVPLLYFFAAHETQTCSRSDLTGNLFFWKQIREYGVEHETMPTSISCITGETHRRKKRLCMEDQLKRKRKKNLFFLRNVRIPSCDCEQSGITSKDGFRQEDCCTQKKEKATEGQNIASPAVVASVKKIEANDSLLRGNAAFSAGTRRNGSEK